MVRGLGVWPALAVAGALSVVAIAVEFAARYQLADHATARSSFAGWVLALVVLGLGAPAAVSRLKEGPPTSVRRAVAVGFGCFDVIAAAVAWRWMGGIDSAGPRVATLASLAAAVALVTVAVVGRAPLQSGSSGSARAGSTSSVR